MRTDDEERIMTAENEYEIMHSLRHPNIVYAREIFIDRYKHKVYTLMDYVEGKEMFQSIFELGAYSEEITKNLFR
jgi:serine/threonine protein kinase